MELCLGLLLVWASFRGSEGLECYVCTGGLEDDCFDSLHEQWVETCASDLGRAACGSSVARGVIRRSCYYGHICSDTELVDHTCCYTDRCNSYSYTPPATTESPHLTGGCSRVLSTTTIINLMAVSAVISGVIQ